MKNIMVEVIQRLNSSQGKFCQVRHKKGWLDYLETREMAFSAGELHKILRSVIDTENNRPRG